MPDSNSQLEQVEETIDGIDLKLDDIGEKLDSLGDLSVIDGKIDAIQSDLMGNTTGINDHIDTMGNTILSATGNDVDYSGTLEKVGQLLAVTDLMLIILCVFLFLAVGLFAGYQVTRWLKNGN